MRSSLFRLSAFAISRRLAAFFLLFSLFEFSAKGQNFSAQIINYNLEIPSWQTATFLNNGDSGVNGAYFTNYGTVQANGNFQVGTRDWAVFYQNGGTFNVNDYLSIARYSGSGHLDVNGGTVNSYNNRIIVGEFGNGSMTMNGGRAYSNQGVELGKEGGSAGTLSLNGGTLEAGAIWKGGGTGNLGFNGGTLKATRGEWNFISGLNSANIGGNGAVIDNDGKGIGINQTLTGSGSGSVKFDGSNWTTLRQNNTYTGDTLVRGGVLQLYENGSLYNNGTAAGNIYVNSGATLYFNKQDVFGTATTGSSSPVTITLNGGSINNGGVFNNLANLTMNGGNLNASGGSANGWNAYMLNNVTVGGSSASTITSNTNVNGNNNILLSRAGTTTFNVGSTGDATGDLKVSARLTNGNGVLGSLTKTGAGKMVLSAGNTYTGGTFINAGTLDLRGDQSYSSQYTIGNGARLNVTSSDGIWFYNAPSFNFTSSGNGNITADSGNFIMSANTSYTTAGGFWNLIDGSRGINLNGYTATFDVIRGTDANTDLSVSTVLWNSGGMVKNGNGIMKMSGVNSYSGETKVVAGTLMVDTGGSIASSSATVDSGATLQVNGAAGVVTVTNGGMVQGSGSITNLLVSSNGLVKILSASTNSTGAWNTAGSINFNDGSKIDVTGLTLSQQPYVLICGSRVIGTPILQGATGFTVSNSATTVGLMPAVDTDGDGLTDYQESQLGTDPQKIDSNILSGVTWSAVYGFANESTSDKSGNGNTLSALTGSPGFVPDRSGSSSSAFQGSTGRILGRSGGLAGFNPANNQLSLSAWIKTTSAGNELLVSMGRSPSSFEGEWIWGISNGQLYFWDYQGSNGFPATFTSTTSVNNGQWRHVAFVRNGLTGTFYIDGIPAGSRTVTKNVSYTNANLVIGGDYRDGDKHWTGQLDDLSISSTALTATQIFLLSTDASVPGVETGPTNSISGLTQTSVNLMGGITNLGGTTVTSAGFYLNTNSTATNGVKYSAPGTSFGLGSFSNTITGLTPGTSYYYRAFAANSVGTSYGANEYSFATPSPSPFTYTNNGTGLTITGYTGTGGSVVIPGTIGTVAVTAIGQNAFQGKTSLTNVVIPNGVTTIMYAAFAACTNITAITLPSTLTSIGGYAFDGCRSLQIITIPAGVTSIGANAFTWCTSLPSITLPSGLETIVSGTFYNCTSLTSISIPSSVREIQYNAFSNCSRLASVYFLRNTPPSFGASPTPFDGIASGAKGYYPATASAAWGSLTQIGGLTIVHPDTQRPVITLIGANPLTIYKGSAFTDPGATVTDNADATRTIAGTGEVNTATVGNYTLNYNATDAAGNLALPVTRTVSVVLDPSRDEDGDEVSNGAETLAGTNPNDSASAPNLPIAVADAFTAKLVAGMTTKVTTASLISNDKYSGIPEDDRGVTFVSAQSTSSGGAAIRVKGGWLIYQPSSLAVSESTDTFTYTVSNGVKTATGTVRVSLASSGAVQVAIDRVDGNKVYFSVMPGMTFEVQGANQPGASATWTTIVGPNNGNWTSGADGRLILTDPEAADSRYYKLKWVP